MLATKVMIMPIPGATINASAMTEMIRLPVHISVVKELQHSADGNKTNT